MAKRRRRHTQTTQPSPEAGEIDLALGDLDLSDPAVTEMLDVMRATLCSACGAQVDWLDPFDVLEMYPLQVDALALGERFSIDEIVMAWACRECSNFSLLAEDFEVQSIDLAYDPTDCPECHAEGTVEDVDPAQAALKNKAQYLHLKQSFGVEALLMGTATACRQCGAVTFQPLET